MDSSGQFTCSQSTLNKIRSLPLKFRYIWQLDVGLKCPGFLSKGGLTHFLGAGFFA